MKNEIQQEQLAQIKSAIKKVVTAGPDFLAHKIPAEKMADTMVKAVDAYAKQAETGGYIRPESTEAEDLMEVLLELKGCGSGFLVNRCDADCVARTITYMVGEFQNKF